MPIFVTETSDAHGLWFRLQLSKLGSSRRGAFLSLYRFRVFVPIKTFRRLTSVETLFKTTWHIEIIEPPGRQNHQAYLDMTVDRTIRFGMERMADSWLLT